MTTEELRRYNRHLIMPEIGEEGQNKLLAAKVLVIGAGGLGCPVLQYLVAAGVGTIGIVDNDNVDESNLQRQILFTVNDIGKSKAETTAQRLAQLNPLTKFNIHKLFLAKENAIEIIQNYDFVIDGTDNFPTRYLVNDACVIAKKPLVFGSIFKFEGQVSVFNWNGGPTYRCLYPTPPAAGDVPNCSEVGVLGVLPGMIGTMMANEALKIILGIGEVLSGKLYLLNALTMQNFALDFHTDPANLEIKTLEENYESFCGLNEEAAKVPDHIREITVQELSKMLTEQKPLQIIDVREAWEYQLANINGILLPMNNIPGLFHKIDRDKPVIVHCHHGIRSAHVINWLQKEEQFTNLYNLIGGIDAWSLEVDESVERY